MHRIIASLAALLLSLGVVNAQESGGPSGSGAAEPTTPTLEQLGDSVRELEERTTRNEDDLARLKAIRISGYVQSEWQHFDQTTSAGGRALYSDSRKNLFTIRRGRIKVQHRLGDVMSYAIQTDVTEAGVSIKDAFISMSLLPRDGLRLDAGMFNRPNFEVELSSSAREATERSQVVRAFYPGERDLGVMVSSRPELAAGFAPRLQLGIFNGPGTSREVDAIKDIAARVSVPVPLGERSPVAFDLGGSFYYGGIPQTGARVIEFADGAADTVDNAETGGMAGFGNNRNIGVESQIRLELLPIGATVLRGELLSGQRATAGSPSTPATVGMVRTSDGRDSIRVTAGTPATPLVIRRQMGYYVYLVQNLGDDLQFVARYDFFDRNTDLAGAEVPSAGEAASSVLGIGLNYTWEKIRLTLYYEMPRFAADEAIQIDPSTRRAIDAMRNEDAKDNKTTLRLQYRF